MRFKLTLINFIVESGHVNIEILPNKKGVSLFSIFYLQGTFIIDMFWKAWVIKS